MKLTRTELIETILENIPESAEIDSDVVLKILAYCNEPVEIAVCEPIAGNMDKLLTEITTHHMEDVQDWIHDTIKKGREELK